MGRAVPLLSYVEVPSTYVAFAGSDGSVSRIEFSVTVRVLVFVNRSENSTIVLAPVSRIVIDGWPGSPGSATSFCTVVEFATGETGGRTTSPGLWCFH